jgi:TRAP-type C4-dicarboxylate transport system permease small subunit
MLGFLGVYRGLLRGIGRAEQGVAIVMMATMVVCIFAQVVSRYLLGQPLVWVEELSTYAFVWGAFVGAAVGLKHGRHIRILSFVAALPEAARRGLRIGFDGLIAVFCALLVWNGFQAMLVFEWRQRTIALPVDLPRYLFYSTPLILAAASMLLTVVYDLLLATAGREGLDLLGERSPA